MEFLHDLILFNVIVNMILCLIIIVWDSYFYFKVNEAERWAKLLYIFVAIIWLVRYIVFFLTQHRFDDENIEPHLLPLLTLTLLSLAVGSVIRIKRINGVGELRKDIAELIKRIHLWIFKRH